MFLSYFHEIYQIKTSKRLNLIKDILQNKKLAIFKWQPQRWVDTINRQEMIRKYWNRTINAES